MFYRYMQYQLRKSGGSSGSSYSSRSYRGVLAIVIESGVLYAFSQVGAVRSKLHNYV